MRIGKWVPLYRHTLPIPRRMSTAFGLFEKSELHLVPLRSAGTDREHECEIIVSPVPIGSWRSACRLSVRLSDTPGALEIATRFLRDERINILMSECCSTYQSRAHLDAICDLAQSSRFDPVREATRETFETEMEKLLTELNVDMKKFATQASHEKAFLTKTADYVRFSSLTGLNDAAFVARFDRAESVQHHAGAVRLSDEMIRYISLACGMDPPALPQYVMVTGNTEQRYMRTLFLKDHRHMFRLIVDNDLPDFAGSGIGVLNQFLHALPEHVNLLRASNYIYKKTGKVERGRIDLIGHWNLGDDVEPKQIEPELKRRFGALISSLTVFDVDGRPHRNALSLVNVKTPKTVYPRVYISFSIGHERDRLDQLMNALIDSNYEPVLGVEQRQDDDDVWMGGRRVGSNVTHAAFSRIDGCVALVSLQIKRDDLRTSDNRGRPKYLVPPWLVAEEIYAWSHPRKPHVLRLRDIEVLGPVYDRNVWEATFEGDDPKTYEEAIDRVIDELNNFATSDAFANLRRDARAQQFRQRFPSPDVT